MAADAGFDPEGLLRALWQRHAHATHQALSQELGTLIVKQAASGICIDTGSPLHVRWGVEWRHWEAAVRTTLAEFDGRSTATSQTYAFLRSRAASALVEWATSLIRMTRARNGPTRGIAEHAESERNLQALLLQLEGVADTECRVIASSAKFASAATEVPVPLFHTVEVKFTGQLFPDYEAVVKGVAIKRGLSVTSCNLTEDSLLVEVTAADAAIANKPDLFKARVDEFRDAVPSALLQPRVQVRGGGDTYYVGQAAAVGPGSRAENVLVTSQTLAAEIDLGQLAEELARLRSVLREGSSTAEHDEAIGALAAGERAARDGDRSRVLPALRAAGKWAWQAATDVGVGVAAQAIGKALGLP